jgi:sugar phosphate isomerase/epimerase
MITASRAQGHPMKIRIGTLVRPDEKYIQQVDKLGFESYSITWGGSSTIGMDPVSLAPKVKAVLADSKAVISSLGVYGNPLDQSHETYEAVRAGWRQCIENAHAYGCDIVAGFTGRIIGKPIEESMPAFKAFFGPLVKMAGDHGVRIVFENCAMGGSWATGDWNCAHNPSAWELMFNEVSDDNIGLQWEPCHQMVQLIDPIPQLRKWAKKIFHIHGKDATIAWDVIREQGIGSPSKYVWHRTPGFGDTNWTDVISILRQNGFTGSIDIEGWHDPVYRGELEMTGQVRALNYLLACRGGEFVENPV